MRMTVHACLATYSGFNCNTDVDECASSPCLNGATCGESTAVANVSLHAYQCTCVAGYANGWCEYDFIAEYSAECTVLESSTSTVHGGNCDGDVDECASGPCLNGATCLESGAANQSLPLHSYECTRALGFANGWCAYDFIAEYAVDCALQVGGVSDVDVDECLSGPCQNGATCTESAVKSSVSFHAHQCTCMAGFANGWCEYDFISVYGTACAVVASSADAGFSGNCDVDVDECASSPCVNGATCSESTVGAAVMAHAYQCSCLPG